MNSSGFARKSTASTINAGAGLVNDAITELKHDLANFWKEQSENNSMVQRHVASIHANMENQTNTVALIGNQLQQFGLSLLAGCDKKAIEGRISTIDNNLAFETQCLRTTEDPIEKASIKANITTLQNKRCEQTQQLAKACDVTLSLIGPAPGTIIPTPPAQTPPQMPRITVHNSLPAFPTDPPLPNLLSLQ